LLNTPSSPVLVGRNAQLALLAEFAGRVAQGDGGAVLVRGDAGAGKSRLVDALLADSTRAGTTVLAGGCVAIGGEPLRHAALIELMRAAGRDRHGVPTTRVAGLSTEEMLEELLALSDTTSTPDSLLVVVEDVHWADRGTCEILTVLARHVVDRPVGLVMTCRDDELPREHPVRQFLTEVSRAQLATPVAVPPLSAAEVARLVETLVGDVDAISMAKIFDRSGGNPLIVEELCAAGAARADGALDGPLRDIMLTRFWRASEPAREVARAVAVAGAPIAQELLASVVGFELANVSAAVREAVDLHVLAIQGDAIWFRHVLMAEAVYGELLPIERTRLHARWAVTLASSPAGDLAALSTAQLLAHHWYESSQPELAFDASLVAARAAGAALAYDAAHQLFRRALSLWDEVDDPSRRAGASRVALGLDAAETANWAGDPAAAVAEVDAALAAEPELDAAMASVLLERRAWYLLRQGENSDARRAYELALTALPDTADPATRARVLAGSVRAWERASDFTRALELAREAVEISVAAGAEREIGPARYMLGRMLLLVGETDAAIDELERSAAAAEAAGNPVSLVIALLERADALARRGRLPDAVPAVFEAAQRLRDQGHRDPGALLVASAAAALLHRLGRATEGRALAGSILDEARTAVALALGHLLTGTFDVDQGSLMSAREHLETARFLAAPLLDGRVGAALATARAEVAMSEGNFESAATAIEEGIDKVSYSGDDEALAHLCLLGLRVQADRDAVALGRSSERARRRRDGTLEHYELRLARVLAAPPAGAHRPDLAAVRHAWAAERTRLDGASDAGAWQVAQEHWTAAGWPRQAVYAAVRKVEALAGAGGPDGGARLAGAVREAQDAALAIESTLLLAEISQLAQRAGIAVDTPAPPKEGVSSGIPVGDLTKREREVLDLVAAGATNRQIASRLFISEKTASVHVSRILTKLGAADRQEAAALARRAARKA
jgi:DNA-binding CsgD family transcriptional regulator